MIKIELESLFSMNYLIQKWSQVQNDHKNAMTIDISELTINVLMLVKPRSLHNSTKKGFLIFWPKCDNLSSSTTHPLVFHHATSRKPLRPTHPPPMRDVIIEQPLYQTIDWNVWGAVQQEIAKVTVTPNISRHIFRRAPLCHCFYYISFVRWVNVSPKMLLSTLFFYFL